MLTINAGSVELLSSGSLDPSSTLTVNAGNGANFSIEAGSGTKGVGLLEGAGSVNINDNTAEVFGGTFSGVISGSGRVVKRGSGTLVSLAGGLT